VADVTGAAEDASAAGRALLAREGCWCPWCLPDGEREVEAGPHRFVVGDAAPVERYGRGRDDSPYAWPWRCACSSSVGASSPSSADAYWAWRRHAGLAHWVPWRPLPLWG
jgi:hypothetical protein